MTVFARQLVSALLHVARPHCGGRRAVPAACLGRRADPRAVRRRRFVPDRPGGRVVGSALIGQSFRPTQWFQGRPSAAGTGYDAMSSGASNLAADNPELVSAVEQRRATIASQDGVAPALVPPDALTASGSGLDPDISPQYAAIQAARVAKARGLPVDVVRQVLAQHTRGRDLGFLGEPRVNVLEVNLALESLTE